MILTLYVLQRLLFTNDTWSHNGLYNSRDSDKVSITLNADQHRYIAKVEQKEADNSFRQEKLKLFFKRFKSPWIGHEEDFIAIADRYSLDWRLLPVIGCVESSCGKHYTNNPFGWGSGSIECGSDLEDAECVGRGISTLRAYGRFRETGSLYNFAKSYNPENWQAYLNKLNYFYNILSK